MDDLRSCAGLRPGADGMAVARLAACARFVRFVQFVRLVLALVALGAGAAPAIGTTLDSGPRVALVIGNAAYRTMPLANPVNDARAVADELARLGFRVFRIENATQKQMFDAVRQFGDALKGGVGLFYFAGHGVQVKGHNFLIPVDAAIEREDEVAFKAFDVGLVLAKMEAAKNPLNIVILDACRNNPFARGSRSATTGLAQIDAPAGSIVAFATAPGAEAADGSGGNGLYTTHLLRYMATPGLKVEDVFKRTRVAVKQRSDGRQIPWESTSLEGDFYFKPPSGGAPQAAAWALVSESNTASAYRAYLERYPDGAHADEARGRATKMGAVASAGREATPAAKAQPHSGFSFSAEEAKMDRATPAGRHAAFQSLLEMPCAPARKRASLRVEISEERSAGLGAGEGFAAALGERLRQAGLRVTTAGPADFALRGTVTSQASSNRRLALSDVSVSAVIDVSAADGRRVSSHLARGETYAGSDLLGAYRDVVAGQAVEVAGQVYRDLCTR
jgi:uncharacterized caspase-like protein